MIKIAILHTDHECDWVKPWKNYADMGIKILEQGRELEGDADCKVEYKIFDVYHGQFPDIGELKRDNGYQGIYITGSRYDSFDTQTMWINDLRVFLRTLLIEDGYPPIAGICFGHQMIASALDCEVSRNPLGLEIGITSIKLNEKGIDIFGHAAKTLNLSEIHYDIVKETPEGYLNWGSTAICEIQGFYRPQKVLSFQGHPEFHTDASQGVLKAKMANSPNYEMLHAQNASHKNDGPFVAKYIWKLFKLEI